MIHSIIRTVFILTLAVVLTKACDCDYRFGGCKISVAARPGNACKCVFKGWWTCYGLEVDCNMGEKPLCAKPDKSRAACDLGNGDCGGY